MRFLLLVLLVSQALIAMDADIQLSIEGESLKVEYIFPEEVEGLYFTYPVAAGRENIFRDIHIESDQFISIKSNKLTLYTNDLSKVSLMTRSGEIFAHADKSTMILTYLTESYRVLNAFGTEEYIENLNYYFNGKLLHSRDVYRGETWERYLLLENSKNKVITPFGDIIIDSQLIYRNDFLNSIKKSLKYLYENLGTPYKKPTVFFTYNKFKDEQWWYDGRVIMGSPYIQLGLGGELDLSDIRGKLILYHAMFSHEVAHHWNARNLDNEARAWVHEGGAEYLSGIISRALFSEELGEFVNYMEISNLKSCDLNNEETDFAYHCGHKIYHLALENASVDAFTIYKELFALPKQSESAVLSVFAKYNTIEVMNEIKEILQQN